MRLKFDFCSKGIKTIQTIEIIIIIYVVPLNNADSFFTAR